jgi:hypothetical protein
VFTRGFALEKLQWPTEEIEYINSRGGGATMGNYPEFQYDDQV